MEGALHVDAAEDLRARESGQIVLHGWHRKRILFRHCIQLTPIDTPTNLAILLLGWNQIETPRRIGRFNDVVFEPFIQLRFEVRLQGRIDRPITAFNWMNVLDNDFVPQQMRFPEGTIVGKEIPEVHQEFDSFVEFDGRRETLLRPEFEFVYYPRTTFGQITRRTNRRVRGSRGFRTAGRNEVGDGIQRRNVWFGVRREEVGLIVTVFHAFVQDDRHVVGVDDSDFEQAQRVDVGVRGVEGREICFLFEGRIAVDDTFAGSKGCLLHVGCDKFDKCHRFGGNDFPLRGEKSGRLIFNFVLELSSMDRRCLDPWRGL